MKCKMIRKKKGIKSNSEVSSEYYIDQEIPSESSFHVNSKKAVSKNTNLALANNQAISSIKSQKKMSLRSKGRKLSKISRKSIKNLK